MISTNSGATAIRTRYRTQMKPRVAATRVARRPSLASGSEASASGKQDGSRGGGWAGGGVWAAVVMGPPLGRVVGGPILPERGGARAHRAGEFRPVGYD